MFELYVTYENRGTRVISDTYGEDGPYTGYSDTEESNRVTSVLTAQPKSYYWDSKKLDAEEIPDIVYVVSVSYSDGGTFSNTSGLLAIEGVYTTYEEAEKVATSIRDGTYKKGESVYLPWEGYFASLEDIWVEPFKPDVRERSRF